MKKQFVTCRDIKNKKYKVAIEDLIFRPSIYGLIFKGNKILLSKQWDGYDFPGGGVKKGELLEDALKREVLEETGLKVTPQKLVEVCDDFFVSIESKRKLHSILIYYVCVNPRGKISTKNLDENEKGYMSAAEWVDLKNIRKIKFYNGVNSVELIRAALRA